MYNAEMHLLEKQVIRNIMTEERLKWPQRKAQYRHIIQRNDIDEKKQEKLSVLR